MPQPDRRGLGRGLRAIIPEDVDQPPSGVATPRPETRPTDPALVRRLADVGLDGLDDDDLSHLAYLHRPTDGTPLLIMRRPHLSDLDPTTAYRLMARLDRAAQTRSDAEDGPLLGHHLRFVPTAGAHSVGVHLVGSRRPFDTGRRIEIERHCRRAGQLIHQLHQDLSVDELPTVRSWTDADQQRARVSMDDHRGDPLIGVGSADTVEEAVAQAIVAAHANGATHHRTQSLPVDDAMVAVLTVVTDGDGEHRLGVCLAWVDTPMTFVAAAATVRALAADPDLSN